ncbi:hypothetical protein [Streptomyces sp. NPDC059008]|uniref:hypothetical protein n=1 Tax=Streptomyces sp. NPDC059008 TaxID=3346693 RepID=UPI0036C02108
MNQQPTTVHLMLPLPQPAAVEGCDVCAALARQRSAARINEDHSRASDCNVENAAHPEHSRLMGR